MATDGVDYAEIRRRVAALRKPELCECLERLNMRKGGNKPDLQRRLLDIFEDSYHLAVNGHPPPRDMFKIMSAQRVVDDVYNKMTNGGTTVNGATSAAPAPAAAAADTKVGSSSTAPHAHTNGHTRTAQSGAPGGNTLAGALGAFLRTQGSTARSGGAAATAVAGSRPAGPSPVVVRCCCGSSTERQPLWQCRATGCGVYQHGQCVGLNPGLRPAGGDFYCELCRAKRADPFWEVEDANITGPIRLSSTNKQVPVTGALPQFVRNAERTFMLPDQVSKRVRKGSAQSGNQLQLVCLQLNDPVPFRFHWPLGASLEVNGVQYRVYSRNSHHKLGANARDEQANIGLLCPTGHNRLVISGTDNSPYVLLLLLVRKRTMEEVKRLMMPQLSVRDALQRVRHQLRGDDDDEVQTGDTVVSLRCPILGGRVRTPGRFSEVPGLATFDLEAFLDSAARTRKWQCPLSMTHSHVHNLQVDTYTQRIIRALAAHPEVMEVEVAADGSWRPAGWRDGFFSIEAEDPLAGRGLGDGGRGAAGGGGDDNDEENEEEEDEAEELRKAAAAVTANLKRKRAPSPEVIDLASSDDEDEQPTAARGTSTTQQQTAPAVAAAQQQQQTAPVNGARHSAATSGAAAGQPQGEGSAGNGVSAPQQQQLPLRIPLQGRVLTSHTSAGAAQPQASTAVAGAGTSGGAAQTAMPFLYGMRRQVGSAPYSTNPMQPQPQQQQQQQQPHAQQPTQPTQPSAQHHSHQQQQQQQQPVGGGTSRSVTNTNTGSGVGATQPGAATTASAATAAGSAGGAAPTVGVSKRQPVTAQARNPIRIQMAANQATPAPPAAAGTGAAQSQNTAAVPLPTPGLPVISPYQPANAGANTNIGTAGPGAGVGAGMTAGATGGVAVPPLGSVPRWLSGANGVLGAAQQHMQQQQAQQHMQPLMAATLQHGQQPHWLGFTALGGSGQAPTGQQSQPQQQTSAYVALSTHPAPVHYYPGQQQQVQQLMPQRSGGGAWPATQQQHPTTQPPQAQAQTYPPSQPQLPSHPQHPQQHAAAVAAAAAFYQHHAAAAQQAVQSQLAQRQMAPGAGLQGAAGSGAGPPPPGGPAPPPHVYDLIEITDSGDED